MSCFSRNEYANRIGKIDALLKTSEVYQNVFCHRDLWYKNLMFKFARDPVTQKDDKTQPIHSMLIDFQLCRYLPPAVDVIQFIYLSTRRLNRDSNHILDYLKTYYSELTRCFGFDHQLEMVLPWTDFVASCKLYRFFAIVFNCIYAPLMHMPGQILENLKLNDPEKYYIVSNIERGEFIIQVMNENDNYKEIILECMNELVEYLYSDDFDAMLL